MATHATSTDLAAFLARYGILAERFEHPPVMTVEESERLVPRLAGAKTKNLFLRDKKGGRHFLVTVPHNLAVDLDCRLWNADAVHAHPLVNTATMVLPHAELERFLAATGHSPRIIEVPGGRATDSVISRSER